MLNNQSTRYTRACNAVLYGVPKKVTRWLQLTGNLAGSFQFFYSLISCLVKYGMLAIRQFLSAN